MRRLVFIVEGRSEERFINKLLIPYLSAKDGLQGIPMHAQRLLTNRKKLIRGGIWGYEELLELHSRRAARKRISAEDRERLEWYEMDRDFEPEYLDLEECREIVEAFNS